MYSTEFTKVVGATAGKQTHLWYTLLDPFSSYLPSLPSPPSPPSPHIEQVVQYVRLFIDVALILQSLHKFLQGLTDV